MTSIANPSQPVLPSAALVREIADETRRYEMFELCALSTEGATLLCMMLLEMDEIFTLELTFDDGERLCVDARVVRHLHERSGIEVAFVGLDETQKKRITYGAN